MHYCFVFYYSLPPEAPSTPTPGTFLNFRIPQKVKWFILFQVVNFDCWKFLGKMWEPGILYLLLFQKDLNWVVHEICSPSGIVPGAVLASPQILWHHVLEIYTCASDPCTQLGIVLVHQLSHGFVPLAGCLAHSRLLNHCPWGSVSLLIKWNDSVGACHSP